jgi:ferredoxin
MKAKPRPTGLFTELLGTGYGTVDLVDPSTCVGCGCTDRQACPEGCSWLGVNRLTRRGVCSNCPDHLDNWKRRSQ